MPAILEPGTAVRKTPRSPRAQGRFLELATRMCEALEGVSKVTVAVEQSSVSGQASLALGLAFSSNRRPRGQRGWEGGREAGGPGPAAAQKPHVFMHKNHPLGPMGPWPP